MTVARLETSIRDKRYEGVWEGGRTTFVTCLDPPPTSVDKKVAGSVVGGKTSPKSKNKSRLFVEKRKESCGWIEQVSFVGAVVRSNERLRTG